MDCPIFNSPYLGENTLRGYGSFTFSQEGMVLPAFHFLAIRCSDTANAYLINMETGISFRAAQGINDEGQHKAVNGLVQSVIAYARQSIASPKDFAKLVQLNESPGNEIFWAQYHKIRLLYPNARSRAEDVVNPIKANLLQLYPQIGFINFAYQTIGE